jgi:cell division protein FtsB
MSARTQTLPRSRVRLTARAGILAVLIVIAFAVSLVPIRQYLAQRARIAQLEHQTSLLASANHQLEDRVASLHDPAQLERLARECLGMVRPGQTAFVVVPKHGAPRPTRC